ncbi:MAG: hypothetical protein Q9202_002197 [Teloschistes flavicans]
MQQNQEALDMVGLTSALRALERRLGVDGEDCGQMPGTKAFEVERKPRGLDATAMIASKQTSSSRLQIHPRKVQISKEGERLRKSEMVEGVRSGDVTSWGREVQGKGTDGPTEALGNPAANQKDGSDRKDGKGHQRTPRPPKATSGQEIALGWNRK